MLECMHIKFIPFFFRVNHRAISFFKITTMKYCPPNITLSDVWVNHGISECFMDTVSYTATLSILLIFGTLQLLMYMKYSTRVNNAQVNKSKLYIMQICFTILIPVLSVVRFTLQATYFKEHDLYGYMVRSH